MSKQDWNDQCGDYANIKLKCPLELGRDYRKPNLFVNEGNGTFSIHGEIPNLLALTFLTYTTGLVIMLPGKASEPFCHEFNGMKEGTRTFVPCTESHYFNQAEICHFMNPLHFFNESPDYE